VSGKGTIPREKKRQAAHLLSLIREAEKGYVSSFFRSSPAGNRGEKKKEGGRKLAPSLSKGGSRPSTSVFEPADRQRKEITGGGKKKKKEKKSSFLRAPR